jgi:hypothetical protein
MLWLSLRTGFGNTAFIVALVLVPLISLANPPARHDSTRIVTAVADIKTDRDATPTPLASVVERGVN